MARPKKITAPLITESGPKIASETPLIQQEREELTAIFNNPVFVKAWGNIQTKKPSVYYGTAVQIAQFPTAGTNRLFEIRGWEAALNALLLQAQPPPPSKPALEPTYPNSGVLP